MIRLNGVHFEERDTILGPNRWLLTTRVTNYADSSMPRGYDPVHTRPYAMIPNGVVATIEAGPAAQAEIRTESGSFSFRLGELQLGRPKAFLDGEASAELIPTTIDLTRQEGVSDYPALAVDRSGDVWATWITYADRKDAVWVARRSSNGWETPVQVTPPEHDDNFRTAIAEDAAGRLWVVWSGKRNGKWGLHSRYFAGGKWSEAEVLTGDSGANLYHVLARDARGRLHLVWQGFRNRKSEILWRVWDGQNWSPETRVSNGEGDNWIPAAAADSKGNLWIGWDGYETGDFNVYLRRVDAAGRLGERIQVTRSPVFDANVSLAVDHQDRLWISWDHGEANWGKDWTSQRFKPGGGAGLYRWRKVRVACLDGNRLKQPAGDIMDAVPPEYKDYFQMARLQPDSQGRIWALGRSLTTTTVRVNNNWGAGGRWEALLTRLDQNGWMPAIRLDATAGRNDVRVHSLMDPSGKLWFAWSRDGRPFGTDSPRNRRPEPGKTAVSYTVIEPSPGRENVRLVPFAEPAMSVKPVHPNEAEDVTAIRSYRYQVGGKRYRILRGDLHRHTDISFDGIGDGSLLDFFRYAFSAGQYDFMMVADHQYGGASGIGLEYNWWRTEKSEDIFLVEGRFWPLFGTERSVPYPNGHRNTIFANRGHRELPISREEAAGKLNTGPLLYPYLRSKGGITTSHTPATEQGTDWRDNDPELEPIVEIYQGLHASYEYENAPRAETPDRRYFHHGEPWRPAGFVWNAWAKGLKLGVQASADHIATHDAYACVLVDENALHSRQDIIDAMKARHTYAATDNIIVDFRIGDHIMGDILTASQPPVLKVRVIGAGPLARVVVIKNNRLVHAVEPGQKETAFDFRDNDFQKGESYYYVRVEQVDGSLAWSSPIWVKNE
ncbi:MAG: hypothetical protein HY238_00560 [Acidobacteria bacterium]|nr:hypothetical protein [Acidobacteriota bacterium]